MMARLAVALLPCAQWGMTGMAWYRPAIRPRQQAANDVAPGGRAPAVQAVLEGNYAALHRRLARHLGCAELASDSLHDAWLRLGTLAAGDADGAALAHSPVAYVFRVACNAAMDSLRRNRAWLYADEGDGDGLPAWSISSPIRRPGRNAWPSCRPTCAGWRRPSTCCRGATGKCSKRCAWTS